MHELLLLLLKRETVLTLNLVKIYQVLNRNCS